MKEADEVALISEARRLVAIKRLQIALEGLWEILPDTGLATDLGIEDAVNKISRDADAEADTIRTMLRAALGDERGAFIESVVA